jgi:hypothetical protein
MRKAYCLAAAALLLVLPAARGALITGPWTTGGRANEGPLTNENTASPTVGDGSANSADDESLDSPMPAFTLTNSGDRVTLTGAVTLTGSAPGNANFRFGLFKDDGDGDNNEWVGYYMQNSSGANSVSLTKKPVGNTSLHMSGTGATAVGTASRPAGDPNFDAGTYNFSMSIERSGSDLLLAGTITNGTTYTINLSGTETAAAADGTYAFDRVALLVGGGLDADQAQFQNIDVTFTPIPEPSAAALAGAAAGLLLRRRRA